MDERIRIEIDNDGVADVCLQRADKMNAIDAAMFDALVAAQEQLRSTPGLRAVVLRGAGRAFCAGIDMGRVQHMANGQSGRSYLLAERTHGLANKPQQAAWGWRELPVPVIAAVHGVAFGGGLQLALGADIRCVAPDVKLSVMEMKWGLVPDMAGMALMRKLMPDDVVRELIYTARIVNGPEAKALGLATWVGDDPLAHARELARQIAHSNPDAVRAAKRLLNLTADGDAAQILAEESREQDRLVASPNQREAARAGIEKRAPVFGDLLPEG